MVFPFLDYILDYYIANCGSRQIPEALLPEGLKELMLYDRENSTTYTKVLKSYLQNDRSISQTVKECFIHRNTFLNWLEKIKSILKMDLDDSRVRVALLFAFEILAQNQDETCKIPL